MDCGKKRTFVFQYTICRLCLCSSSNLMDVFLERYDGFAVKEAIEDLLRFQVSKVNDSPWLICDNCVEKLNEFRLFKSRCLDAKIAFESRFPEQCMPVTQKNVPSQPPSNQRVIILPITHSSALSNIENLSCPSFLSEALKRLPSELISWNGPTPNNNEIYPKELHKTEVSQNKGEVILPDDAAGEGCDSLEDKSRIQKLITPDESEPTLDESGINVEEPQTKSVHLPNGEVSEWSKDEIPPSECKSQKTSPEKSIGDEEKPSNDSSTDSPSDSASNKYNNTIAIKISTKILPLETQSTYLLVKPISKDSEIATQEGAPNTIDTPLRVNAESTACGETSKGEEVLTKSDNKPSNAMSDFSVSFSESDDYGTDVSETPYGDIHQSNGTSEYAVLRPYKCAFCERRFRCKEKLDKHLRSHPSETRPFKCSQCTNSYKGERSLRRHLLSHSKIPIILKCPECDMTFTRANALKNHMKKHIKEVLKCEVCEKTFKHRATRSRHMKVHISEKEFSCETCGKSFSFKYDLNNHLRGHSNLKPYLCEFCGKGFSKPQYLRYHSEVHAEVKRHVCGECGRAFAQYSALWQHKKWHKGEKRFVCEVCSKGFVLNSQLVQHRKKHVARVDASTTKPVAEAI